MDHPTEEELASLAGSAVLDLSLEEEPASEESPPRSQRLLIGPVDSGGRIRVHDTEWEPIALAEGKGLAKIEVALDSIIAEINAPPPDPGAVADEGVGEVGDPSGPDD